MEFMPSTEVVEDVVASQAGMYGRLYQNFKALKTNAELKGSENPVVDSAVKVGVLAAVGGAIGYAAKMLTDSDTKKYVLEDEADSIYSNPDLAKNLHQLQTFRELDEELFKDIVSLIERMVHLEIMLHSKKIAPRPADRWDAMDYDVQVRRYLTQFQMLVAQDMGPEFAVACQRIVTNIKNILRNYYLNLMALTGEFRIENTLKRAPAEVRRAARRLREQERRQRFA